MKYTHMSPVSALSEAANSVSRLERGCSDLAHPGDYILTLKSKGIRRQLFDCNYNTFEIYSNCFHTDLNLVGLQRLIDIQIVNELKRIQ